jgi:hypothetical protein
MYQGNYCPKVPSTLSDQNLSPNMMHNFDKCRSYAEVAKSFYKCGVMHDHVYSHNISDHENIYEIHTTNHVDHSYSYYSPTENPDVKEPERIQSTPYFKTYIPHEHDYYQNKIESVEISKSPNTNPFYQSNGQYSQI